MATKVSELVLRVRAEGARQAAAEVQSVSAAVRQTGEASKTAQSASDALWRSVGSGAIALAVLGQAGAALKVAAEMERIQIGLEGLTGSAKTAQSLLRDLQKMGQLTPFDTAQLADFARTLLAMGFPLATIAKDLATMADAVAAMGMGTEAVGRLAYALGQISATPRGIKGQDLMQLTNLGLRLDRLVSAATGQSFANPMRAKEFLSSMTGEEIARILIRGIEKQFGGSAQRLGTRTLAGIWQNVRETISLALLPTGQLLLAVVSPLAKGLLSILGVLQRLNEATRGLLGLAAMGAILAKAFQLLIGAGAAAISSVNALAASVMRLGGASLAALPSVSLGGAARFLKGGLGLGLGAAALGMGAEALGHGREGRVLQSVGAGLGIGGGAALIPGLQPFAPLLAIVGALGGLAYGLYSEAAAKKDKQEEIAQNTKKTAEILSEMKAGVIGGGERSRRVFEDLRLENLLALALRPPR